MTADEVERLVHSGVWRSASLFHVLDENALRFPDRLAVADQHRRYTYGAFAAATRVLARWLIDLDLPRGAVVALQTTSSALIPLVHFGCDRADLTFLPMSDAWREREVGHLLARSRAQVYIGSADTDEISFTGMVEKLRPALPDLRVVIALEGGERSIDDILRTGDEHPGLASATPNDARMCMVTSGTSGLPKISLYTDNNLWFFMSTYIDTLHMDGPEVFANLAPASTGSTGYLFPVLAPLLFGSSCVMLEHWNPVRALELLGRERVTVAVAVPTQIIKMLDVVRTAPVELPCLRAITQAGAPLPPDVASRVDETFGCRVMPLYGATDGGVPSMTTSEDPADKRHHTVGRIVPQTELRIVDEDGKTTAAGVPGEVQWRNPMKTLGYLNDDEQTAGAFTADGLYRSGDLGVLDDEGYLRIVGRAKDVIIRGGQNISPREIEDVVVELDTVVEAAAIGLPDPVYGERVCLCVVPADGSVVTLESVGAHLRHRGLSAFMIPERLELFDQLPSNSGGKTSKPELRTLVTLRAHLDDGKGG